MKIVSRFKFEFSRAFRRSLRPIIAIRSAKLLVSSGLFDAEYVSIQIGKTFESDLQAALHYVKFGLKDLVPCHPLLDPWYLEPGMRRNWKQGRIDKVLQFLDSEKSRDRAWSAFMLPPGLPADTLSLSARELVEHVSKLDTLPRFKNRPAKNLDYAVARKISFENAELLRGRTWVAVQQADTIDWTQLHQQMRSPGLVSIIISIPGKLGDTRAAIRNFRSIALGCSEHPAEFIFLVHDANIDFLRILLNEACSLGGPITVIVPAEDLGYAHLLNHGIANSEGEYIAFLDLEHKYDPGWLAPLLADMADESIAASQSLFSTSSLTVENAGFIIMADRKGPVATFSGLALDDARQSGKQPIHALSRSGMVHRAADAISNQGFDKELGPFYGALDYSLRLAHGRDLKVNFASLVMKSGRLSDSFMASSESEKPDSFFQKWHGRLPEIEFDPHESVGLGVTEDSSIQHRGTFVLERVLREASIPGWGVIPRLRWAIKNPAPLGPSGDLWGDTIFANDLAKALRKLGQHVVIDRRGGFTRDSSNLDDVELLLHGLRKHSWTPDKISVYWVISHPELIAINELLQPDLVYAASRNWAAEMQVATGREVRTLWQAFSTDRFRPIAAKTNPKGVFVGIARKTGPRQVVMDALQVGAEFQVWGKGWAQYIDSRHIAGDWLDPESVNEVYGSARFVLNDHWGEMAEQGFINNRMFDAAASGARIISDYVEGIEEIFGAQVKTYRTIEELQSILSDEGISSFPSESELRIMAEEIHEKHSFDARAETLLRDVLKIWEVKRGKKVQNPV